VTFEAALEQAHKRPRDPDVIDELARAALSDGEEDRALPFVAGAAAAERNALLWQWKGLLERSIEEHAAALHSFERAVRLDPGNASIVRGRARVALEAGVPAEHFFQEALELCPSDASTLLGLMAARLAAGNGMQAEAELDAILHKAPTWVEGHNQLAQLRSMLGKSELVNASLERALRSQPQSASLWRALFELKLKQEKFEELEQAVELARTAGLPPTSTGPYAAIALSELGRTEEADRLFAESDKAGGSTLAVWKIRHLLRSRRTANAIELIDRELSGSEADQIWPYAGIAWRLADDQRWDWLVRDGALISVFDLRGKLPPLDHLANVLRSIHRAKGEHMDQSVRGGTQTDGPLFSRIEPEIRALRSVVVEAIGRYLAQLPDPDPKHPLLSHRRDRRVRFAGSWSVRLTDKGFHTSHVHSQGWISSALYIALPPALEQHPDAGGLQLGEPPLELRVPLNRLELIRPEIGRLVLFPSWMWHGTIPFPAGERLTVAFDVSVPH
jgi:tetratricopeptide (TPR) repeat protein